MKRGKSQYSVEFLVTYGWALLIIGIVVGAIYTFGWFDPGELLPQKCEFYGQLGCRDFYLNETDFKLSLVNNFGANLNIGKIDLIVNDDTTNICSFYFDKADAISWTRNDHSFVNVTFAEESCVFPEIYEGARVKLTTTVYYYSPTTCDKCDDEFKGVDQPACTPCLHKSVGRLNVRVN